MVSTDTTLIGVGLYTPVEAAYYARVTTQLMTRWVHGNRSGTSVLRAQLEGDHDRTITFLDLVQTLAIRAIRREFNVPLQKIREAVNEARDRYEVLYPFAMNHKTFLFDKDIHIQIADRPPVQISGSRKGQTLIHEIAEPYIVDLTFSQDGLANSYSAYQYNERKVILDPSRRLGQPIIQPCNCTVDSLLDAYRTEGSTQAAAKAYGVDETDVLFAIRYNDFLGGRTAA